METITIKPHHFMDIIKLYGAGIENFVPDKKLDHDFYRIGNLVLACHTQPLLLTIEGDDICTPCRQYRGLCQDALANIPGFTGKNEYNRALDSRILSLYGLSAGPYPAEELCGILYQGRKKIFQVWQEEENALTQRRFDLFTAGAEKYLGSYK
ncbi:MULTISPECIES: hypothetical protein [unclassified Neglectibacter]|uniref:hypothetical protein n=1 Tax=unclassified Neglectibacter TaxID=2632164 RepID=UPI00191BE186|nr:MULTISPECIES: hypothetical protein [unclassified Neglectibacter]